MSPQNRSPHIARASGRVLLGTVSLPSFSVGVLCLGGATNSPVLFRLGVAHQFAFRAARRTFATGRGETDGRLRGESRANQRVGVAEATSSCVQSVDDLQGCPLALTHFDRGDAFRHRLAGHDTVHLGTS